MRHARALLAAPPQRMVLEIAGPITSTKGLDLPDNSVAACALAQVKAPAETWRDREQGLWKTLARQPGYLTHVLLRGVEDHLAVGSISHWANGEAFHKALGQVDAGVLAEINEVLTGPIEYVLYRLLRD